MISEDDRYLNGIKIREDGSCDKLKSDNTCEIYEQRPDVCRITSHHKATASICNMLMDAEDSDYPRILL